MATMTFLPRRRSAWVTPIVTVDFPSPAGVGLIPVTSTSRPFGVRLATASAAIFALFRPYGRISSGPRPTSAATSTMGRSLAAWAIAISEGTVVTRELRGVGRLAIRYRPSGTATDDTRG